MGTLKKNQQQKRALKRKQEQKAKRNRPAPFAGPRPAFAPSTAFQGHPTEYLAAVAAQRCPYDSTPLDPNLEPPPNAPAGLIWCPKCGRGFGPIESGFDEGSDEETTP